MIPSLCKQPSRATWRISSGISSRARKFLHTVTIIGTGDDTWSADGKMHCRMGLARLLLGLKLEELMLERCSDILQASAFVAVASLSNLKVSSLHMPCAAAVMPCPQMCLYAMCPSSD